MYLLGKIRFPHDSQLEHVSVGRFFLSLISFSFAIYLIPGLWGAPLKSVSAFVPPLYTQDCVWDWKGLLTNAPFIPPVRIMFSIRLLRYHTN